MPKLLLLRHLESRWNLENRFTGWVDVPLCKEGIARAEETAQKVFQYKIDTAYSSPLLRNQNTLVRILDCVGKYPIFIYLDKGKMRDWGRFKDISQFDLPVYISEALNGSISSYSFINSYLTKNPEVDKEKVTEVFNKLFNVTKKQIGLIE